jgi:universal stress protein A
MTMAATPQQRRRPMPIKEIVCCADFSENAETAFAAALEMAEKYTADLTVIHVLPPPINPTLADTGWIMPEEPRESLVQQIEELMAHKYGSRINGRADYRLVVLDGHVSTEIIRFLNENPIDVVVLGAYGLSGMGLVIFGSVAKRVAHKAPCSVMIVRSRT